jgi:hypothetical protein
LCALSVCAHGAELAEYQIKAEFIERFTRFIEWPAVPSQSQSEPFVIGIIGRDPFNGYLDAIARARTIKGRSVKIQHLAGPDAIGSCQILFLSSSEKGSFDEILALARKYPVLTIGDSPGALAAGVMINLYTADNKVRFEINEQQMNKAGFAASAQLLKLARSSSSGGNR